MVSRAYLALCSLIIAILLGSGTWQMQGDRRAPGPAQVAHGRQRGYRHRAGRNGVLVGLYAALVLLATRLLSFQTPVARGRLYAGGGGVVQSAAAPGAASGGSALQPDQI